MYTNNIQSIKNNIQSKIKSKTKWQTRISLMTIYATTATFLILLTGACMMYHEIKLPPCFFNGAFCQEEEAFTEDTEDIGIEVD